MAWEDCVVDVHSATLSQHSLETMFSKCGAVKTVIHWKGQGEKQHVFLEYRSPSAADSARAIGLDRSDIQVIKLSNNEMLKRKFRELEKPSCQVRAPGPFPNQDADVKVNEKDCRLPAKPTANSAHAWRRDREGRYRTTDYECTIRQRHGQNWSSSSPSCSFSNSQAGGRFSPFQVNPSHSSSFDKHSMPSRPSSTLAEVQLKSDGPNSHYAQDPPIKHAYAKTEPGVSAISKSFSSNISRETSNDAKSELCKPTIVSPAIIDIPHAGEIIKFDLDKQLEPNPTGIIRILSTVKASQKLWMMTAAHYNGKCNLEAAKAVLEAAIEMAIQTGTEKDTKPFWHLLTQINGNLITPSFDSSSASPVSPTTSVFKFIGRSSAQESGQDCPENGRKLNYVTSFNNGVEKSLSTVPHHDDSTNPPLHGFPSVPDVRTSATTKTHLFPHPPWPAGVPDCELHLESPVSDLPHSTRLRTLQSEINVLREKQNAVLEDLSAMRVAKRRIEDEVKEERSIRRKLEKHLKVAEDALTRSKRMEDAALDQVKREVEARRRAEDVLAVVKAEKNKVGGGSHCPVTHSNVNDAALLFQLASIIRGTPSNETAHPSSWRLGVGTGVASSAAGSQPET